MKTSLFEIERQYRDIVSELEDNGGEITPEIEELLAINKNDFEEKVESYFVIIENYKSQIDRRKLESERLLKKNQQEQFIIDQLEEKLKIALHLYGGVKTTKTGKVNFSMEFKNLDVKLVSQESESVKLQEGFNNPSYCDYKITNKISFIELEELKKVIDIIEEPVPDKSLIKKDLDKGVDIQGAKIESKYNIKFK